MTASPASTAGARKSGILMIVTGLVLVIGLVSCQDNPLAPNPLAPFEPEVLNNVDSFALQATGVDGVSTTLQYNWENTGTAANVNQASVLSAGGATLLLRDASGTMVYSRDLAENGTFVSSAGTSGTWTIEVQFSNCSGDVNFRSEKP